MPQKLAADLAIPTSDYPHIPDTLTLVEALTVVKLKHWGAHGGLTTLDGHSVIPRAMLVFNKDLEFVGMVRRRDIMRGLLPWFLARKGPKHPEAFQEVEFDPNVAEMSFDRAYERMRDRGSRLIREVMIPITTINHDDHLIKAVYEMVKYDTSELAVVREGNVIGVVRSVDVMYEIQKMLGVSGD
jgi:CBS domain-containing protein